MPVDGLLLHNLCSELQVICDTHVDKIFQPSKDELVFVLRSAGFCKRLFISARPGAARIHFTDSAPENPQSPPMFCMLARKHLSGAKIISVEQAGFERILTIRFSATGEMGDRLELCLTLELIGNQSNIILINEGGRIIDSVRRSDIENSARLIQPGATYELPEPMNKKNIETDDVLEDIIKSQEPSLSSAILSTVGGISPLLAREIAFSCSASDCPPSELDSDGIQLLRQGLLQLHDAVDNGKPYLLCDKNGIPKDFACIPINQYSGKYTCTEYESFSTLLDAFYTKRENAERIRRFSNDMTHLLTVLSARAGKKLLLRKQELKKCETREQLRIYGELIKANIALIPRGAETAEVPNYYDENLATIKISLNPALSPAANATKYFKEYRKLCTAEQTLGALIEECETEKEYIDSVLDLLARCETVSELFEIREELTAAGYLRKPTQKSSKRPALGPKEYVSSDGFRILAGRNNIQNDRLTLKTAAKDDIWLHTKNIHGSHVIIICGGKKPPDSTLLEAAQIAAFNSQAKNSSNVPVDYAEVRFVKKPSGSKPGMVIYTSNKTLFVEPKEK